MEKQKRKFKLIKKISTYTTMFGFSCALSACSVSNNKLDIEVDNASTIAFDKELEEIYSIKEITFENDELYALLQDTIENLTPEKIKKIKNLEIKKLYQIRI